MTSAPTRSSRITWTKAACTTRMIMVMMMMMMMRKIMMMMMMANIKTMPALTPATLCKESNMEVAAQDSMYRYAGTRHTMRAARDGFGVSERDEKESKARQVASTIR